MIDSDDIGEFVRKGRLSHSCGYGHMVMASLPLDTSTPPTMRETQLTILSTSSRTAVSSPCNCPSSCVTELVTRFTSQWHPHVPTTILWTHLPYSTSFPTLISFPLHSSPTHPCLQQHFPLPLTCRT